MPIRRSWEEIADEVRSIWNLVKETQRNPEGRSLAHALCMTLLVGMGEKWSECITSTDLESAGCDNVITGMISADANRWRNIKHRVPTDSKSLTNSSQDSNPSQESDDLSNIHQCSLYQQYGSEVSLNVSSNGEPDIIDLEDEIPVFLGEDTRVLEDDLWESNPEFKEEHQIRIMRNGEEKPCDLLEAMSIPWEDRRFFITRTGYMGLGPADTAPGDEISILFGYKAPVVLRAQHDGPDTFFYYIGPSYLHGTMQVKWYHFIFTITAPSLVSG